jgi:hypothetical protein
MVRKAEGRCAVGSLAKIAAFAENTVGPGRDTRLFTVTGEDK